MLLLEVLTSKAASEDAHCYFVLCKIENRTTTVSFEYLRWQISVMLPVLKMDHPSSYKHSRTCMSFPEEMTQLLF